MVNLVLYWRLYTFKRRAVIIFVLHIPHTAHFYIYIDPSLFDQVLE